MVVVPARFGRCRTCDRLIAVGGVNQDGQCTRDCGGSVHEPRQWQPCPPEGCLHPGLCMGRRWCMPEFRTTLDRLAVVHSCDGECGFGGEGCIPAKDGAPDAR